MDCLLHIGPDNSKGLKHLPDLTKALVQLLQTQAGDAVKIAAIGVLRDASSVSNVSVSNSNFSNVEE